MRTETKTQRNITNVSLRNVVGAKKPARHWKEKGMRTQRETDLADEVERLTVDRDKWKVLFDKSLSTGLDLMEKITKLGADNELLGRLVVTVGDYQQYQDQETFEAMDNALAALKETTE